jgi:hypothetical protein
MLNRYEECEGFVRPENERRETFFTLFRQTFAQPGEIPLCFFLAFHPSSALCSYFSSQEIKKTPFIPRTVHPGLKCIVHVFACFACRLIEAVGLESADKRLIIPSRRAVSRRLKIPQTEFSRPKPFTINRPAGKPPLGFARPLVKVSVSHRFKRVRLKYHLPNGAQAFKIRTIRPHPIDSHIADQQHSLLSFAFRFRPEQPCH